MGPILRLSSLVGGQNAVKRRKLTPFGAPRAPENGKKRQKAKTILRAAKKNSSSRGGGAEARRPKTPESLWFFYVFQQSPKTAKRGKNHKKIFTSQKEILGWGWWCGSAEAWRRGKGRQAPQEFGFEFQRVIWNDSLST